MNKLSACIEMIFGELPFEERIGKAKAAGFDGYEFWGWTNKDIDALFAAQQACGLPCAACGTGSKDAALNEAYKDGGMLKAKNAPLFAQIVRDTIEGTKKLGIKTFLVTTGNELAGVSRESQREGVVEALKAAAPVAEAAGVMLVLEPLNLLVDHKGYFLARSDEAFQILRQVNSLSVKLLFDIYHQQITEGNLIQNITRDIDLIGHFHLADVPGRHQPGTGEINYDNVIRAIAGTDYNAFIGCEYRRTEGVTEVEAAKAILGYAHRA